MPQILALARKNPKNTRASRIATIKVQSKVSYANLVKGNNFILLFFSNTASKSSKNSDTPKTIVENKKFFGVKTETKHVTQMINMNRLSLLLKML